MKKSLMLIWRVHNFLVYNDVFKLPVVAVFSRRVIVNPNSKTIERFDAVIDVRDDDLIRLVENLWDQDR